MIRMISIVIKIVWSGFSSSYMVPGMFLQNEAGSLIIISSMQNDVIGY